MRTLIGVGTPRGLQGRMAAVRTLVVALWTRIVDRGPYGDTRRVERLSRLHAVSSLRAAPCRSIRMNPLATGW